MRRIYVFLLVVIATVLSACSDESNTTVALDTSDEIKVFKTQSDEEYLEFLNEFDSATNTIISISTDMRTYKSTESYMVVYTEAESGSGTEKEYRYYLYKTRSEKEFTEFYSSLDLNTYEIVDVSTHLRTFRGSEAYLITYRKVVDK